MKVLHGASALTRVDMSSLVAAEASAQSAVEHTRTIEFLYLDQETVLAADLPLPATRARFPCQVVSCSVSWNPKSSCV